MARRGVAPDVPEGRSLVVLGEVETGRGVVTEMSVRWSLLVEGAPTGVIGSSRWTDDECGVVSAERERGGERGRR